MNAPFAIFGRKGNLSVSLLAVSVLLVASAAFADIVVGLSTTNSSTNVTITDLTLSKPSDVVQGDLMLANVAIHDGSAVSVTPPSGWTQILRTDNDVNISIVSYWKIAGASEPTSYIWTLTPQTRAEGGITRYTGVDTSNPIDASAGNTGRGKVATTSSVTTTADNDEVVALYAAHDGSAATVGSFFSTSTGMAEEYDNSYTTSGPSIAVDDALQATAGAAGSKSSNLPTNRNHDWAAQQIALRKLPAAPSINGTITTQTVDGVATSSVIFSHAVATGSNQVLIVTLGANNTVDTSATYDGIAMTQGTTNGFGTEEAYDYWYLVNPPLGTHDVVITFPYNTNYRQYAAITFQNVDQTTPFDTDTHVGGNGGNPSASVTTTESNESILYFLDYDDRSTNLIYTPNDTSIYRVNTDSTGSTFGNQGAVHTQTSAGTVSVGGSGGGGGGPWDLIAAPIRPAH
jgi:hypothetical protein